MEKPDIKVIGNLGKDKDGKTHDYKLFESQKSTISFTIHTEKRGEDPGEWVHIRAFNSNAEKIKKAIEVDGIKTFTFTGNYKQKEYTNKKDEQVKYDELQVNSFIKHKNLLIEGQITKHRAKETTGGKKFDEYLIVDERIIEGKPQKQLYNLTVWPEQKAFIPKDVELKTGNKVYASGRANILENKEGTVEYTTLVARNVDKTLERLQGQIDIAITKSADKV